MKTAVPVQGNSLDAKLSGHFGSAPYFAIIEEDGSVNFLDRSGKAGGGCAPVDELLSEGVNRVISIGMGQGALNRLKAAGIDASFVVKAPGRLEHFITALQENTLMLSNDIGICVDHGHGHEHEHGKGLGCGHGQGTGRGATQARGSGIGRGAGRGAGLGHGQAYGQAHGENHQN